MFGTMKHTRAWRSVTVSLYAAALALVSAISSAQGAEAQLSTVSISRLQVRVRTCNLDNSQSSDRIYMRFGSQIYPLNVGWAGSKNAWKSYEMVLPLVATSSNQLSTMGALGTTFTIGKVGTDGWCFNQVELYLNGWQDNGGPTVVDSQALIFQSSIGNQWIDGNGGYQPTYTFNLAADTTNFTYRPYLTTHYHVFGIYAIQDMLASCFNHLTSPAGFLYGRTYGTPTWQNLPIAGEQSHGWPSFTFNTTLRAYATGTSTPIPASATSIQISPVPTGPNGPLAASAVPSSQELQSAVSLAIGSVNKMIDRDAEPRTATPTSAYTRTGGPGNSDFWLVALP